MAVKVNFNLLFATLGSYALFILQVALIGPSGSCKTILAKYVYQYVNFVFLINNITTVEIATFPFFSFLADATETVLEEHQPTKVVRILEFESNVNVNNRNSKADIELW